MPRYNYICRDCENKAIRKFGEQITEEQFEQLVLFETSHAMEPTEAELKEAKTCPRCGGINCDITVFGTDICSYIRGYGWLDREGAKRDMHRYQLVHDDPYAQYRVPGEVDEMKKNLEKPKDVAKKVHFVQNNKSMQKAVEQAVKTTKQ